MNAPLDLSRIQALCFDVDGTLRDTDDQYIARVNGLLRPLRKLFPEGNTAAAARSLVMRLEDPVNRLFGFADRLGMDGPLQKMLELTNPWRTHEVRPDTYRLVPDIVPALEKMAARFHMAIITVRGLAGTQAFLEHSKLSTYFRTVATVQTTRRCKPFPDQILWVAQQLAIAPQSCLMVGDTTYDIRAGKAAGAQAVGVLSGFGDENELRRRGADLILPSVATLPAALGLI